MNRVQNESVHNEQSTNTKSWSASAKKESITRDATTKQRDNIFLRQTRGILSCNGMLEDSSNWLSMAKLYCTTLVRGGIRHTAIAHTHTQIFLYYQAGCTTKGGTKVRT